MTGWQRDRTLWTDMIMKPHGMNYKKTIILMLHILFNDHTLKTGTMDGMKKINN